MSYFTGESSNDRQSPIWEIAKRFNEKQAKELGRGKHGVIVRRKPKQDRG